GQAAARRGSPAFLHSPCCPAIIASTEKAPGQADQAKAQGDTCRGIE
uniref:CA2+/calmodulin-dependent myosin light chain kinase (Fragments) n=1 Tax=Oryctolagus cuniculus TaxID=9986 RepID=Q9TSC6_RABIT